MRIVSLLPSATEIVCALGLQGSLVAITHECDFPASVSRLPVITSSRISHENMSSIEIDHAVRTQLDGHGSIYDLDVELLESLSPDLILTQELCDVCAVSYKTVNQAAKVHAADATIISLEPNSIEDIFDTILTVGEFAGVKTRAEDVVAGLADRLGAIGEKVEFIERRPRVMMLEWLEPPFAPGHWVPEQVETAGGESVMGEAGKRSMTTTYEAIRESNPEILVFIPCGYYIEDVRRQLVSQRFPEYWQEIDAFRDGNVWAMDATKYFSRPGPRIIEGIELLAKVLHPETFGSPLSHEAFRLDNREIRFTH